MLRVRLLSSTAAPPRRGSSLSAGLDIASDETKIISPQSWGTVSTGLSVAIPSGHYGRIAPRSGLALRNGIDVGAGVIDEDYRGMITVILFNHSKAPFEISVGDRIAQLILERITIPEVIVVDDLDETERGKSGFGSTGVKSTTKE